MFSLIPWPYKLLASITLLIGVFAFGYMKGSASADTKIAEYAAEKSQLLAKLEKKNSEISTTVVTEYVDRVNVIREKEYVYRDLTQNYVPSQHIMSNGWVYTHNISATNGDADSTRASDASPSGIADNTALGTIVSNYATCEANAAQLIQLQRWITDNKVQVEKSNAEAGN